MNEIFDDLFYGKNCGIAGISINANSEFKDVSRKLKSLEMEFLDSNDGIVAEKFENIKNCYQRLLFINLRVGYKQGLKVGFKIVKELSDK